MQVQAISTQHAGIEVDFNQPAPLTSFTASRVVGWDAKTSDPWLDGS
jgi:hypothetical protein